MAQQSISLSWKDHPIELATLCKTFRENNELVDCSISAGGQSLKAHRLILSVCSPYFHMLFNEEREKYPIVVLFDASFENLKALIDFVYSGEVQIPQGNLEAFLALVQALQIKGLNTFTEKDVNKNLCGNSAGNAFPCPYENNEDICEGQDTSANSEDSPNDLSQEQLPHLSGYTDAQTRSSLPFEGSSDSWEKGESGSVVPPLPGQPIPPGCDKLAIKTEINVNSELSYCEFLESKRDLLDDLNSDEQKSGNLPSEMEEYRAPAFVQQNLIQSTSGGEFSGNVATSTAQPPPQLLQEQQNFHLLDEKLPGPVAEQPQPLFPVSLVPKSEPPNDTDGEESMDDQDVLENDTNETGETELAFGEQSVDLSSSTLGPSPLLDQPVRKTGGQKRHHICSYCHKTFRDSSRLRDHMRIHTGERPFHCSECGASFSRADKLAGHKRTHTGERPHACDVCGKTFAQSWSLTVHKRIHTGERACACNVCGKTFTQIGYLTIHMRIHTGERPFACDVCGKTFIISGNLTAHKRIHTGERPFTCDVCGMSFIQSGELTIHKRFHTGERPYSCDVCGKDFVRNEVLTSHMRIHTGERPFPCDVCSSSFITRSALVKHLRRIHQRD